VLASKHRGAALKELEVSYCATIEVIHALERGAFPQLEKVSLCLENVSLLELLLWPWATAEHPVHMPCAF
jgi:hypothetical protein